MNYRLTKKCCYVGYIVQAMAINFLPLLFVTFKNEYNLSYALIGTLISVNFLTQLGVDIVCVFIIDRIGYRQSAAASQFFCVVGFIMLAVLPQIMNPFLGLCISVILYSTGAGLIEVVINPIIAGLPKEIGSNFVLTHSFYCWGQLGVVLFTTIALQIFGMAAWRIIALFWALIPLLNGILFINVPISPPIALEKREGIFSLFRNKVFIAVLILMICAGGSELAMAQWASTFAQNALGINKTMGDLLGPCMFAFFMGIGRLIYGLYESRMNFKMYSIVSSMLCIMCYMIAALSKNTYISLVGCGLCGFAISTLWPGVVELASQKFPQGSGSMYSAVAIFGDIGCSIAPFITGVIASIPTLGENALRTGMLFNIIYPTGFILIISGLIRKDSL